MTNELKNNELKQEELKQEELNETEMKDVTGGTSGGFMIKGRLDKTFPTRPGSGK